MRTKIVQADSVESSRPAAAAEAAILLAIATCPVLFIPFANNPFEPHKAAFLWVATAAACAAVGCAPVVAWRRLRDFDGWSRAVLLGLACAVVGLCISAARSEGPYLAWWGSTLRRYGALTQVSLLAVVGTTLVCATGISTSERLVTALILASVGPTVYAVAQALQLDPLTWDLDQSRGNSTFGNWLFFAGYVATVWPLTFGRAVIATRRAFHDQWSVASSVSAVSVWALLGLQSAALAAAGSRGPLLALVTTSAMAGIATLVLRGRRVVGALVAGLTFTAVVVFLVVAPPRMAAAPALASEASSMPISARSAVVRLILWDAIGTGLGADIAAGTRAAMFGAGPESTTRLVTRNARPGLNQLLASSDLVPDRAHNDTLETLAIAGLVGLLLQLAILGAALGVALVGLGLLDRSHAGTFAWFESAVLCGAAALAIWRGGGLGALAVAPPAALVLIVTGWISWRPVKVTPREPEAAILLAAVTAACVVHFIDIQLSIATIGSALTASVAMAVALSLAAESKGPASIVGDAARTRTRLPQSNGAVAVLIGWSAVVLTIGLAGLDVQPGLSGTLIVAVAWSLSLSVAGADRRGVALSAMTWAAVSALWFLWQASPDAAARLPLFNLLAFVCLTAVTVLLAAGQGGRRSRIVSTAAALAAGGLVAAVSVRLTAADVYVRAAALCAQQGDYRCATAQFQSAIDSDPMNDQALTQWALTQMASADSISDAASADVALTDAERALRRAQAFDPFNYQHPRNIAAVRRRQARRAPAAVRAAHLEEADRLYRVSTHLAPFNGVLWAEWANLDAERLRPDDALAKLDRAASLGAVSEATRVTDALLEATGEHLESLTDLAQVAANLKNRGYPILADLYARRSADTSRVSR